MMTINGYFGGTMWNKDTRSFDIKTIGERSNGAILCGLNVSGKDKEGNREYGKPIDVFIKIKSEEEGKRVYELISSGDSMLQMDGFFTPNNWTNKEGTLIRGNQFLVLDSESVTTFTNTQSKPKEEKKEDKPKEVDECPW